MELPVKFSVVIPLYNKEIHVYRTVNSVLNQTYQGFEIIVVNDGSTDDGRKIVSEIDDERIKIVDQDNQGVSAARNKGTAEAAYEYIAFLDADDEWLPDYLSEQIKLIEKFPQCGAYATAVETIRPNGVIFHPPLGSLSESAWVGLIPNIFELFQLSLSGFLPSSIVVPVKIINEVGGFPIGVKLMEDITCWIKISIGYPIAFNAKRLAIYHQESTNRSNINRNLIEPPFCSFIDKMILEGKLNGQLALAALEFSAQQKIFVAVENIMIGNKFYAIQLLKSCSYTKKYKNLWLWWRFWSIFPPGLPAKLMTFKKSIWINK